MPYEFFLALRYLYSRRRRPLARVTALAAIAGIACGVAALIVALALANGFRDEMRDKILRGTAHLTLIRKDGGTIEDWRKVVDRVRGVDGVRTAEATTYDGALLSGPNGSAYAVVRGIAPDSTHAASELRQNITEGSIEPLLSEPTALEEGRTESQLTAKDELRTPDRDQSSNDKSPDGRGPDFSSFDKAPSEAALPSAVLGAELAARTGLRAGDVAQIISGDSQLTPLGLAPRFRRLRVAGVFRSGLYEYDATWIYVSLATASSFAGAEEPQSASVISISVADIYGVGAVAAQVRALAGDAYTTVDWQEANRPLFAALALERRMGALIIALIILIATLNITTTLVLVVVERRADIAILSAMGARPTGIMLIFMIEGALIGLIGALAGVALGLAACLAGDRYKLVSLPADVYSLSNVPFHPRATDVLLAALVAFLLSLLATLYPARAAARVRPAEALRDN